MLKYIDEHFTVLDDTLLAMRNPDKHLVIPAEIGGLKIRRIGSGFAIGDKVETVILENGIEEIGENAFVDGKALKCISLPESCSACEQGMLTNSFVSKPDAEILVRKKYKNHEVDAMKKKHIPLSDGGYLITDNFCLYPELNGIFKNVYPYKAHTGFTKEMNALYRTRFNDADPEQFLFEGRRKRLPAHATVSLSRLRQEMAKILLTEKPEYPVALTHDDTCDEYLRNLDLGENVSRRRDYVDIIMLCSFYEDGVMDDKGYVPIVYRITFGMVYFLYLHRLILEGQEYHVLREYYLSGGSEKVFPLDVLDEIYDSFGNVVDPATRRRVAEKFKLLSMIV